VNIPRTVRMDWIDALLIAAGFPLMILVLVALQPLTGSLDNHEVKPFAIAFLATLAGGISAVLVGALCLRARYPLVTSPRAAAEEPPARP
jgi:Na+-driven multidrug efflux pump